MAQNGDLITHSASSRMMMPPYPDRFYAAARYAAIPGTVEVAPGSENTTPYSDLTCLALYSLYQQAANGACKQPKPWAWNIVELAKWQSWNELGNMNTMEAMRLFVRALEDEDPDWWLKAQELESQAAAEAEAEAANPASPKDPTSPVATPRSSINGLKTPRTPKTPTANGGVDASPLPPLVTSLATHLVEACQGVNTWALVPTSGRRPSSRYQHASIVVGDKMVIVGGNIGRFVNDVQALDLSTLTWSKLEVMPSEKGKGVLPACAGHALATLDDTTILIVGGHQKAGAKNPAERMGVVSLDLETMAWRTLKTTGEIPSSRGGHSATRMGDVLWVFGGEDIHRHLLAEVFFLNLTTLVWTRVETSGTPPTPRCDHCATIYNERYLTIFGGGSHSFCYNDVYFLDLETYEWTEAQVEGRLPSPRAGHAGVTVGSGWFIVGGGDNKCGLVDTMVLDLDTLTWSTVTTAQERTPISSEGLTVVPVESPKGTLLLAFGGYNGKYNNELLVLRPDTTLLSTSHTPQPMDLPGDHKDPTVSSPPPTGRPGTAKKEPAAPSSTSPLRSEPSSTPAVPPLIGSISSTSPSQGGLLPPAAVPSLPTTAAAVVSGLAATASKEKNTKGVPTVATTSPLKSPATTFAVMQESTSSAREDLTSSTGSAVQLVLPKERMVDPVAGRLQRKLDEAQANTRRLEEIVAKERANAIESAAEARADAWAAITKSQQDIQAMREKVALALASKQQAEDELAEQTAQTVAAQASSASAQAECGRLRGDLAEARGRVKEMQAELARIGSDAELGRVRKDYAVCKQALAEAEQEVQSARSLYTAEQARCFKLEVEVAELRQQLSQMRDLQAELDILQRQKEMSEEAAASNPKRGGWGLFS